MLKDINSPEDIRKLSSAQITALSQEIRTEIVSTVTKCGGHLSSNLGVVELTLALHRVFHTPQDKIIFDVGHQTYAHKLITGRYPRFCTLRSADGISGFPKPEESAYDCYATGHASTAISAALGMARSRDMQNESHHVIAVVGDGALTGGMCYEALNDAGNTKTRLIVILNDNEMSISRNVGALSKHLTRIRGNAGYRKTKSFVKKGLSKVPFLGKAAEIIILATSTAIKKTFAVKDGFFSTLGFRYLGPVKGHDLKDLEFVLRLAKRYDEPVLVHCVTQKGHGYIQAEEQPDIYHGIAPFYIDAEKQSKSVISEPANAVVGKTLVELADTDKRIVAITAAMANGTGLNHFASAYPERFFDVGIAEQHAVTMAAGLASTGMRPYLAVYASFMQRGYDQILHDVCIQQLPVCFLLDHAGIVSGDGETHQGVFDIAFLRHIPHLSILAPRDKHELMAMIRWTTNHKGPCAIRYPATIDNMQIHYPFDTYLEGCWEVISHGMDGAILAVGSMVPIALEVSEMLNRDHIVVSVVSCSTVKPLDQQCVCKLLTEMPVFTIEEHIMACGFGSEVCEYAAMNNLPLPLEMYGIFDNFVPQGERKYLLSLYGLTAERIYKSIKDKLEGRKCHDGR